MIHRTGQEKVKRVLICLALVFVAQVVSMACAIAVSGGEWAWSLRLAIHDLKYYPDQLFPELSYPIDWDVVMLPQPVNDFTIQVPQGSEISWVNRDRNPSDENGEMNIIPHLIQIKDRNDRPIAQSPLLTSLGQTFKTKFDEVGEFTYRCMIHPQKMHGEIQVLPWGLELVQRRR